MVYAPESTAKTHGGFREFNTDLGAGKAPLAAGKIVAYENKLEYTYACAELERAYGADRVQAYRGHFLYLRGERECFVVYDSLKLARPKLPATWLMHPMNNPAVLAGEGLVFPTAERMGKDDAHVRLSIKSAASGWEVELARTPEAAGSVKHLGPDGETVTFLGALTGKVEENGDIPGYSWNPTKAAK
jgi:hypothetical protein